MNTELTYPLATDEDFEKFKVLITDLENFTQVFKNDTTTLWTKLSEGSPINITRAALVFKNLKPEVLYDVIHEAAYRKTWDEKMIELKVVEQLDPFNQISYYAASAMFPISPRDFVNLSSWRHDPVKGEWIIINRKTTHKNAPEKPNIVRAETLITGYVITRTPEGDTAATYITQTDPKGWIPTWAINTFTTKFAPSILDTLYKAALKYPEWKEKNNHTEKPWLGPLLS